MNIYPFQPLDAANLAELKVALNGFLQKGETIKLETKVWGRTDYYFADGVFYHNVYI